MTTSNSEKVSAGSEKARSWRAFSERLFDQNKFAIKLGLDSMRTAFEAEGEPQRCAPAIVVGGTNGKGGTSAAIVAILEAHGVTTGFYSSPHLIEVRERFRVGGRPVSREIALRHGQHVLEEWGDPNSSTPCLTFFELTTLMAARIFAESEVEVAVWEVGLGGRLDAVNAIEPALTAVTSIGYDHQQYLGDTIEEIAGEKAALFRPETPAFIGHQQSTEALEVLQSAAPHAAYIDVANAATVTDWNHELARAVARHWLTSRGVEFDEEVTRRALSRLTWWGRRDDRVVDGQRYLIDAAHNAQGAQSFYEWVNSEALGAAVFNAMRDKDLASLLEGLRRSKVPVVHAQIESERAADRSDVEAALGRSVAASVGCRAALEQARDLADGRPIAVFGSLYLLGEVYNELGFSADDLQLLASVEHP